MLLTVLGIINYGVLLFFGIFISAAFLGIANNLKNRLILLGLGALLFALEAAVFYLTDMKSAEMLYPFITHLPLLLVFTLYFRQRVLPGVFAVMSAYLYCQVSKWFGILALAVSGEAWVMYAVRIAVTLPLWYLIDKYAAGCVRIILSKPKKTVLIFGILPLTYYLFDYTGTVYTELLYSGSPVFFEFLPFILCVAYLFFSLIYFKEYEEKCEAEHKKSLTELQTAQSIREIEELRRSEYEIALIRHDMRHFLNGVGALIEGGEYDRARDYIKDVITATEKTAVRRFCENRTVNMILSSFEARMRESGVRLEADVSLPGVLPCPELELTSVLSNGLENALNAVCALEEEKRAVYLKLTVRNGKLTLSIENPCMCAPRFIDGLPVAQESGHGLGTRSISNITQKLNGSCQFTAAGGMFTMRVVL